jgi:hypothetical protein
LPIRELNSHQVPVDVLSVRLLRPPADEQPAATAAGQLLSESVAVGVAYGVNEPLAVPPVIEMLVNAAAPVTTKFAGCFHLVGVLPEGVVHLILNIGGADVVLVGVGRAVPLKIVAQLLAVPGMWNFTCPAIAPMATKPPVVTHGLDVLPRMAFTLISSWLEVPPFLRAGEKSTIPFQTPPAVLHVTWPGRITGFVTAWATADPTVTTSKDGKTAASTSRIFRDIKSPLFGSAP